MELLSAAASTAAFAVSVGAFAYGAVRLLNKNTLAYFHFLLWGVACFALLALSACVSFLCDMEYEPFVSLGSFGSVGVCIAFLSANFGVLDRVVDEGTPDAKKARGFALLLPAAAAALTVWICVKYISAGRTASGILSAVSGVPMILSCYFNIKHLLLPPDEMGILKATEGCDIMCLIFVIIEFLYMLAAALDFAALEALCFFLRSAALLLLMIFAVRGAEKWQL